MTRIEKYAKKREKLKFDALVIEATYLLSRSDEQLTHSDTLLEHCKDVRRRYEKEVENIYL